MKPSGVNWNRPPKACFHLGIFCSCRLTNEQRSLKCLVAYLHIPELPMYFLRLCSSGGSAGGFHLKCFSLELNDMDYNILYKLIFFWKSSFSDILCSNCQWIFYSQYHVRWRHHLPGVAHWHETKSSGYYVISDNYCALI